MLEENNDLDLPSRKKLLATYYNNLSKDSAYLKDITEITKRASDYLDQRIKEYKISQINTKLAIVLDVDDTSLSNYLSFQQDDFANNANDIHVRYHMTDLPPIDPMLHFYNHAIEQEVTAFFVTARKPQPGHDQDEDLSGYVIKNLYHAGYKNWHSLYLPQKSEFTLATDVFKSNIRKKITENGYTILLNMGDQESDLIGGYAEQTEKLPNFLYGNNGVLSESTNLKSSTRDIFMRLGKSKVINQVESPSIDENKSGSTEELFSEFNVGPGEQIDEVVSEKSGVYFKSFG